MTKTLIAAAIAAIGLASVSLPAQAAAGLNCDTGYSISDNDTSIAARLAEKGIQTDGIEDWGGCVRAYVTKADGTTGMAFFDPVTLKQVGGDAV